MKVGLTSKIEARTDSIGKLIRFIVLPGESHDLMAIPDILQDIAFTTLMGDKAFDSDGLLDTRYKRGAEAVIPPKANCTRQRIFDLDLY